MKALIILLVFSSPFLFTQKKHNVNVLVGDIRDLKGNIIIQFHKDSTSFLNDSVAPLMTYTENFSSSLIIKSYPDIPEGIYAVSVFHDENNNKILDRDIFGVPKEGYGVSGKKIKKFKFAKFENSKFTVNTTTALSIRLKY